MPPVLKLQSIDTSSSAVMTTSGLAHFEELLRTFQELWKEDCLCDVELMGRNGTLKAHRVILAASSDIFRDALSSSMSSTVCQISLPDVDIETIEIAVTFMYQGLLIIPDMYKNPVAISSLLVTLLDMGLNEERLKACDVIFVSDEEAKKGCKRLIAEDLLKSSSHISGIKGNDLWLLTCDRSVSDENTMSGQQSVEKVECSDVTEGPQVTGSTSSMPSDENAEYIEQQNAERDMCVVVEETEDIQTFDLPSIVRSESLCTTASSESGGGHTTSRLSNSERQLLIEQLAYVSSSQDISRQTQILPSPVKEDKKSPGTVTGKLVTVCKILVTFQCQLCGLTFHDRQAYNQHRTEHVKKEEISDATAGTSADATEARSISEPAAATGSAVAAAASAAASEESNIASCASTNAISAAKASTSSKESDQDLTQGHSAEEEYGSDDATKPYECTCCGRRFMHRYNLARHARIHTGIKEHLCHHCGKAFIQKASLVEHLNYRHPGMGPGDSRVKPVKHVKKNSSEAEGHTSGITSRISAELVDSTSTSTSATLGILIPLPGSLSDVIDNTVSSTVSVDPSTSRVSQSYEFLCKKCGSSFESRTSLSRHPCPTTKKSYTCSYCDQTFAVRSRLQQHVSSAHEGLRPFSCAECNRGFTQISALRAHERIHAGIKPHQCAHCGKAFTARSMLEQHLNIHTGVRPHRCALCEKTFTHKETLVVHMRTHTGEKPFQCQICGTSYTQSHHLKGHMLTHTGIKPFQCQLCSKSYKNRVDLRFHCLRIHQIDIRKRPESLSKKKQPQQQNQPQQLQQQPQPIQLQFDGFIDVSHTTVIS